MKKNPSVDNIFNTAFYEGCRISTTDLAQFGEEASVLKSNQFLLKGYGRYHHILAGKVRYAGEERYCIGVPGIIYGRNLSVSSIFITYRESYENWKFWILVVSAERRNINRQFGRLLQTYFLM